MKSISRKFSFFSAGPLLILLLSACAARAADGDQQFASLGVCKLESGKQIEDCRLGFRTWGRMNADRSNVVLAPTWFTGTSAQLGDAIVKTGMVDPGKFFVVAIDAFADGVSSSPSNSTAQPRLKFPAVTTRDMVDSEYRLATETLHLKHVHAVMGISMGGMQTFEWMVDYPDFMDLAVPIVGSTRLTSYDLLLWHGEEDALRADPDWKGGDYGKTPPLEQVTILHNMNISTPAHYANSLDREKFSAAFESYKTSGSSDFDANDRLYQLEAMVHHDVAHGGSLEEAAKRVKARVMVVASEQDHMVNPGPALKFAKFVGAKVLLLTSDCGHLAPGCEGSTTNPAVAAFLEGR